MTYYKQALAARVADALPNLNEDKLKTIAILCELNPLEWDLLDRLLTAQFFNQDTL